MHADVTTDDLSGLPQRSGRYRAMVRAGDSVTAYLRTGSGRPVLLLRTADHHDAFWGATLEMLSTVCRVILPEQAPDPRKLNEWFGAFHDALGLGPLSLVVDENYAMRALQLALDHSMRIERLVLVNRNTGESESAGTLTDNWTHTAHPILVIGAEPTAGTIERIAAFVRDSSR